MTTEPIPAKTKVDPIPPRPVAPLPDPFSVNDWPVSHRRSRLVSPLSYDDSRTESTADSANRPADPYSVQKFDALNARPHHEFPWIQILLILALTLLSARACG